MLVFIREFFFDHGQRELAIRFYRGIVQVHERGADTGRHTCWRNKAVFDGCFRVDQRSYDFYCNIFVIEKVTVFLTQIRRLLKVDLLVAKGRHLLSEGGDLVKVRIKLRISVCVAFDL